jgi:hypothetical protein
MKIFSIGVSAGIHLERTNTMHVRYLLHERNLGMGFTIVGLCRYFLHVMDIPNLAERLSCVLFVRNFGASVAQIRHHLGLMASAAKEVRESADFKLLLQFVLAVGNFMNSGTAKGAAQVSPSHVHVAAMLITPCCTGTKCWCSHLLPL